MLLSYVEELPPHIRERAIARAAASIEKESSMLYEAVPEARTAEGSAKMKESIYALTDEYGVSRALVARIVDHKTVKMLYDFARLKESVKSARANVKPIRSNDPAATAKVKGSDTTDLSARIAKAKQTRNSVDEALAVDALLKGKRNG